MAGVDEVDVGRDVHVAVDEPVDGHRSPGQGDPLGHRRQVRGGVAPDAAARRRVSSASIIRAVDVLPFVPATRMTGYARCGDAQQVEELGDPVQRRCDPGLGPPRRQGRLHDREPARRGRRRRGSAGRRAPAEARARARPDAGAPIPVRPRPAPSVRSPPWSNPCPPRRPREADPRRARGAVGAGMGGAGHLPLRPDEDAATQIYSIDTPPPTVSGSLHVGHVFSYTHTDTHRPLPAHARARGLLPDGLGRQRAADRAPGAELLRRPLRPVAAVRPRLRAAGQAAASSSVPISRRNFVELCERLTAEDEQTFEALWRRLGPVGRLVA